MLSCFIESAGPAFSIVQINPNLSTYDVGSYSADRAVFVAITYLVSSGGTLTSLTFAGTSTTILAKKEILNGDNTVSGSAIGIYTGTATSGTTGQTSSNGTGVTNTLDVFKVLGYNDLYDAKDGGLLGTIDGKAAITTVMNGTISLINPTDGSSITTNGAGVSFA